MTLRFLLRFLLLLSTTVVYSVNAQYSYSTATHKLTRPLKKNERVMDLTQKTLRRGDRRHLSKLMRKVPNVELQLVIANTVENGYTPKEIATQLLNSWNLYGILILVVMEENRIEIEFSDGLSDVMDADWCQEILITKTVPLFRRKKYAQGLEAIIQAIHDLLKQKMKSRGGRWVALSALLGGGAYMTRDLPPPTPPKDDAATERRWWRRRDWKSWPNEKDDDYSAHDRDSELPPEHESANGRRWWNWRDREKHPRRHPSRRGSFQKCRDELRSNDPSTFVDLGILLGRVMARSGAPRHAGKRNSGPTNVNVFYHGSSPATHQTVDLLQHTATQDHPWKESESTHDSPGTAASESTAQQQTSPEHHERTATRDSDDSNTIHANSQQTTPLEDQPPRQIEAKASQDSSQKPTSLRPRAAFVPKPKGSSDASVSDAVSKELFERLVQNASTAAPKATASTGKDHSREHETPTGTQKVTARTGGGASWSGVSQRSQKSTTKSSGLGGGVSWSDVQARADAGRKKEKKGREKSSGQGSGASW